MLEPTQPLTRALASIITDLAWCIERSSDEPRS
jgi:hypothetical protein